MSELLQSGQHPDADQLSAFAEHVLPAHEQEATLAHLAVCSACRSVVALSLPPAEERPIALPARRPWLSGWNLVWSGTAALAAMVLVGVLLRNGPSVPSRDRSEVPTEATAAATAAMASTKPLPPSAALHELLQKPPGTIKQPAPPRAAAASRAKATTTQQATGALPGHDGQLRTAPAVPGVVGGIANGAATPGFGATQSVTVSTANDALVTEEVAVRSVVGLDQAQVILSHHPLPSGLPALSAVVDHRQVVVIDAQNTLFLSDDAGEHWSTISPPWQGRAVKVDLASSTPGRNVDAMRAGGNFRPSPAPLGIGLSSEPAAQGNSSIRGDITDPAGASIPNVSVVVTNVLTRVSHTTRTDGSGHYAVENLAPGTYTLEAGAPGFASQQLSGLALSPAQQSQMNLRLAVGSLSQTVEVQGQNQLATHAPVVSKAFAARGTVLSRFAITTDTGEQWTSTDGRSWKRK
jgi:hypothetical protein